MIEPLRCVAVGRSRGDDVEKKCLRFVIGPSWARSCQDQAYRGHAAYNLLSMGVFESFVG